MEKSTGETCGLTNKNCKPCEGGVSPMTEKEIRTTLKNIHGWEYHEGKIAKTFQFKDFYQTMAFVNTVAWVAHRENHHPDLEVSYNKCRVSYKTHAINGLSENDFICAAKVEALFAS